ncbi:MAG: gene transfer agent family protein [Alsobacter sp.]
MANWRRGEIEAVIGGERRTLCLTLGALAELEAALGAEDLPALGRRLEEGRLSSRDLIRLLGAGLRGAGAAVSDEELAGWPVAGDLGQLVSAAGRLLAATFGGDLDRPPRPGPDASHTP